MKKFNLISLWILAMMTIPAVAFAAPEILEGTTAGNKVITDSGAGDGLTFNPSPNVNINVTTDAVGYAMTSTNLLPNQTNGMEYAAHHEATGYAQRKKTGDSAEGAPATTGIGLAGIPTDAEWQWMGGGGEAGS
jgi:hypothetical protein